jgi:hypothetical protein
MPPDNSHIANHPTAITGQFNLAGAAVLSDVLGSPPDAVRAKGDCCGYGIGVATDSGVLRGGYAPVHVHDLNRAGADPGHGIGANGIAPIRGTGGIGKKLVVDFSRASSGHGPGRDRGCGRRARVETDVPYCGVRAGQRDFGLSVQLSICVVRKSQIGRRNRACRIYVRRHLKCCRGDGRRGWTGRKAADERQQQPDDPFLKAHQPSNNGT